MSIAIVWHHSDLRTDWNPALSYAAKQHEIVIPLFIFDPKEEIGGASLWWLNKSLHSLDQDYKKLGNQLCIRVGPFEKELEKIIKETKAETIYFNACFEPNLYRTQKKIADQYDCRVYNGNHLIDPREIEVKPGKPYSVFTPFYKCCLKHYHSPRKPSLPQSIPGIPRLKSDPLPKEEKWMHKLEKHWIPGREAALVQLKAFTQKAIADYKTNRDFPAIAGTSRLSPHLHFGELSPHEIWAEAGNHEPFKRQLMWREFGTYFLFHFPTTTKENWNQKFDRFTWDNNANYYKKWKEGQTGYPIIDAAMRSLWETGWMHNRLRMLVASFLTKDLFIHWSKGEEWFWDTLVDADKGNNVLGWQWTAGSGPDAAPYFRIFNPLLQSQKFDPDAQFIKRYVPELAKLPTKWIHHPWDAPEEVLEDAGVELGKTYPKPIVDHHAMRDEALSRFEKIK